MVNIMTAGRSSSYPRHDQNRGAPPLFQPSPWQEQGLVGDECDDVAHSGSGEITTNVDGSLRNNALVAESGNPRLPRDSSTCMLWCAVALGALVRGYPLAQVSACSQVISLAPPTPAIRTSMRCADPLYKPSSNNREDRVDSST